MFKFKSTRRLCRVQVQREKVSTSETYYVPFRDAPMPTPDPFYSYDLPVVQPIYQRNAFAQNTAQGMAPVSPFSAISSPRAPSSRAHAYGWSACDAKAHAQPLN